MNKLLILFAFWIISQSITAQVKLDSGLVDYHPFNGNAHYESGKGNDAYINTATLVENRFRKPNSAYGFNGKNQCIVVRDNPNVNFSGAFTI